ncbi:hypothetical protein HID58_072710 [Brassica napus]|uniref:Uncharacterized protein n=1 Tax=Brassica napus TaxID=3708 RepID=A0ABQ7Z5D1_BRANA|nr:hypothetical protein HID58_072710 [Brassica napus]
MNSSSLNVLVSPPLISTSTPTLKAFHRPNFSSKPSKRIRCMHDPSINLNFAPPPRIRVPVLSRANRPSQTSLELRDGSSSTRRLGSRSGEPSHRMHDSGMAGDQGGRVR